MRFIILGAGAVGSFYGAALSKHYDTLLIGRKQHVDVINKKGLEISGEIQDNFKVKAATEIKEIKDNTVILLTTKVGSSEESINAIKDKLKDDTIIVCVQNGYKTEEIVRKLVKSKVLRAVTNCSSTFISPGVIRCPLVGYTKIEESEEIANALKKVGFDAEVSDNINKDSWYKLLTNLITNPLTAILGFNNSQISGLHKMKRLVLEETKPILKKEGVEFPDSEFERIYHLKFSDNISSMLQDLRKGRKTEIDYMNGAVVELGKKHGIKTPVNEMLVEMIKALENLKRNDLKGGF